LNREQQAKIDAARKEGEERGYARREAESMIARGQKGAAKNWIPVTNSTESTSEDFSVTIALKTANIMAEINAEDKAEKEKMSKAKVEAIRATKKERLRAEKAAREVAADTPWPEKNRKILGTGKEMLGRNLRQEPRKEWEARYNGGIRDRWARQDEITHVIKRDEQHQREEIERAKAVMARDLRIPEPYYRSPFELSPQSAAQARKDNNEFCARHGHQRLP
jgi:hypothetical protein